MDATAHPWMPVFPAKLSEIRSKRRYDLYAITAGGVRPNIRILGQIFEPLRPKLYP